MLYKAFFEESWLKTSHAFFSQTSQCSVKILCHQASLHSHESEEWPIGLRHGVGNKEVLYSNSTRCKAGLTELTSLRGSRWPSGQSCTNAVPKLAVGQLNSKRKKDAIFVILRGESLKYGDGDSILSLRMMLLFENDTIVWEWCCCLRIMLLFENDAIVWEWWYCLRMILLFENDAIVWEWRCCLRIMLLFENDGIVWEWCYC